MAILAAKSLPKTLSLSVQSVNEIIIPDMSARQGYAVTHSCVYTWCSHLLACYLL